MSFWSAFFSIVLIVWIGFGAHLYTCKYKQLCDTPTHNPESIILKSNPGKDTPEIKLSCVSWEERISFNYLNVLGTKAKNKSTSNLVYAYSLP